MFENYERIDARNGAPESCCRNGPQNPCPVSET